MPSAKIRIDSQGCASDPGPISVVFLTERPNYFGADPALIGRNERVSSKHHTGKQKRC